jgi:diguanylate cyclase (GGDEF)-like protein/PAS domain S-box-containing protein
MTDLAPERTLGSAARAAQKAALATLGDAELMAMADSAPVGLFAAVQHHGLVLANARFCEIAGRRLSAVLGHGYVDAIHPDDRARVVTRRNEALESSAPDVDIEYRVLRPDGEVRWVRVRSVRVRHEPAPVTFVGSMMDVTEFKQIESALRTSEARLRDQASILEMIATSTPRADTLAEICRMVESHLPSVRCTILLVDEERGELVHGAAPSFPASFLQAIDGMPISEDAGICGAAAATGVAVFREDILGDPRCASYHDLARERDLRSCWSFPIRAASDERVLGTVAAYLAEVRGPTAVEEAAIDSVIQLAAIAIERTQFEDQLAHQAHHDPLTRLANRTLFGELLEHALRRAQRAGSGVAVLFLDLDRFKIVNDSLGHDAGDELLVALGRRLGGVLRPGDVVARFGGDEFTVLCEDLEPGVADRQSIAVAERLIDALREPFLVEGEEQFVSASVGIAISITGVERPEALLCDADAAMYRAKERGKGRCEVFDEQMRDRARQRHETENALHRAVARAEFRVFFQPIISLRDGTCVGVEALARWQHPERGLLTPGEFLGTAEETGLVVPIGAWVLEDACRHAVSWREALPSNAPFWLSVNLSGRQLVHAELADVVAGVLESTGMDPEALCVEITETVLMEDIEAGVAAVKALKALGVRVSIDDFGTGYSTLGYLRQFPVDDVKIDRTFVERLGTEPEDAAIVAAVVSLGHALGVTVTGEGVETEVQLEILRDLGVDAAQGYLFAPPQPPADLTPRLLRPHRWL